jgi:cytochrome P450
MNMAEQSEQQRPTSGFGDAYEDGVEDVYRNVALLHDGPPTVRDETGVRFARMEDVLHVTKRRDVHSMAPEAGQMVSALMATGRPLIPLMLDGAEHTKYRKLLDPLFAPKEIAKIEVRTRALCEELIDRFAGEGRVELYGAYCDPLPSQIFLTLLGLPLEDMEFLMWFKSGVIRPTDDEHAAAAGPKMIEYIYADLDRRAGLDDAGGGLLGGFLQADVDGHRLTHEDIVDIVFLLVLAGLDTVASTLSCSVEWLARHTAERQVLIDDASLWPAAIEELLRIQTPVPGGGRYATADFMLGEVEVKAGDNLSVLWAAANLDPTAFENPTEFDLTRPANRHIAFASGFHRCLGSHLARMELRVALTALHERIPDYELDPDHPAGLNNVGIRNVDPLPLVFTPR